MAALRLLAVNQEYKDTRQLTADTVEKVGIES